MTKIVYSKFRWDLSIYHFPETWMVQNIEKKANRDIRKWLSLPISGNVNHLRLKVKQLGIGLKLSSDIYSLKQSTVWNILQSSKNQGMRELFEITGMINIRNDSIVKRSANAKIAKSTLDNEIQNEIKTWMNNLKEQTTLMSSLQQNLPKTLKINWNSLTNTLPPNIFNFCGKALIFSINKNSNLAHWNIRDSRNCDLCDKSQMEIHFLNNCTSAINDRQLKWRHDSILKTILFYFTSTNEYDVFANVEGYRSSAILLNSSIQDIVVMKIIFCIL